MTNRRISLLVLIIAAILGTACQPAPKAAPAPARVAIAGDSVTVQALMFAGNPGWDGAQKTGLGWVERHAQPRLTQDVTSSATSPDVLIMAFGHNHARGWSQPNANEGMSLALSPHPTACTIIALPHYDGANAQHRLVINQYRAWAMQLAAAVPARVITVDLAPALRGRLAPDGVHLREGDGATGQAMVNALAAAIPRCP